MDKKCLLNFANTIWWQFGWREEWAPDSITRFGWEVKIKSIHKEEFPVRWVNSFINWCKPNWDVIASIFKPWLGAVSLLYQLVVFALKSPMATIKIEFLLVSVSKASSRLSAKVSKMSLVWLGDLYKKRKLHVFPLIFV